MLRKITKSGSIFIGLVTAVLGTCFLLYSLLTIWDMFSTELKAFASYDLLKYRPNIENEEPPYLDDLIKINPDTAAWLTLYETNIDYPVMQGKTDMEYVNKTATGDYSPTGAIFLSTLNKKDFSDPYNLVYGHHMMNGSMFGDIDKFKNRKFFHNERNVRYKKDEGVLIMEEKVYNLKVIAFMETDAYNKEIYHADKSQADIEGFLSYVKENAQLWRDVGKTDKVLALSTCQDAVTNGRSVLICQMKLRTDPLPTREGEPLTKHRRAIGHSMAGAYWALLNLIVMLFTVYTAFPLHLMLSRGKRRKKSLIQILVPGICAVASFVLFYLTEDFHKPIQVIDMWTPIMIGLLIIVWAIRTKQHSKEKHDGES